MDTIRILLGYILKIALGLFLLASVLWLVGFLYPQFSFSNVISGGIFAKDWLPAPKNYGSLLGGRTTDGTNGRVYVPGPAYEGYKDARYEGQEGVDFVVYTASGTRVIKAKGSTANTTNNQVWNGSAYADRSLYVRNLSIFEGNSITYGQVIVGEARDTMFKNGIFLIHIIDANGRLITSAQAINTGSWAIPGWARFQATIPVRLPANTHCSLIFQSGTQSLQFRLPVVCK